MMNFKKALPITLAFATAFGAHALYADEAVEIPLTDGGELADLFNRESYSVFEKISGTVTMLIETAEGNPAIRVTSEDGAEADFFIDGQTALVDNTGLTTLDDVKEGDAITVYYVQPAVMTMIYPPQYTANVMAFKGDAEYERARVSFFDENLLSSEGDLVIRVPDDTKIITQSGAEYTGDIKNRALVVYFDIMALSYPAQATPDTIIVLDYIPDAAGAVPALPETPDNQQIPDKLAPEDFAQMTIFVNGEYIENAAVYVDDQENILFPLRAIAEAMDYTVSWNDDLQKIVVGVAINLSVGDTEYTIGRMAPLTMETAPVIVDGLTYVPGDFISTALGAQIDISQGIYNITSSSNN